MSTNKYSDKFKVLANQYKHLCLTEEGDSELPAGLLFYKRARIVAQVAICQKLLQDEHGTGHVCVVKTYSIVWAFFWVASHVFRCEEDGRWLPDLLDMSCCVNPHELVNHPLESVHRPREVVYLDILDPVTGIRL